MTKTLAQIKKEVAARSRFDATLLVAKEIAKRVPRTSLAELAIARRHIADIVDRAGADFGRDSWEYRELRTIEATIETEWERRIAR